MAGGNFETARIELGTYVLGIVQVGTNGFDVAVPGLLSDVQYMVELPKERSVYSWMERISRLLIGLLWYGG